MIKDSNQKKLFYYRRFRSSNGSVSRAYVVLGRLLYTSLLFYRLFWVRRSRRALVLLIDPEQRFFLTKNWMGNGRWRLPGGGLHKGESFIEAAQREILEEIGISLTADHLQILGQVKTRSGQVRRVVYSYHLPRPLSVSLNRVEIVAGAWFDRVELAGARIDSLTKQSLVWQKMAPALDLRPPRR